MAKNKLYSETMRELSLLDEKSLLLYQMRWGLIDVDEVLVEEVGYGVYSAIPPATPVAKNAMLQIMASFDDDLARKEWARLYRDWEKLYRPLCRLTMILKMVLMS